MKKRERYEGHHPASDDEEVLPNNTKMAIVAGGVPIAYGIVIDNQAPCDHLAGGMGATEREVFCPSATRVVGHWVLVRLTEICKGQGGYDLPKDCVFDYEGDVITSRSGRTLNSLRTTTNDAEDNIYIYYTLLSRRVLQLRAKAPAKKKARK